MLFRRLFTTICALALLSLACSAVDQLGAGAEQNIQTEVAAGVISTRTAEALEIAQSATAQVVTATQAALQTEAAQPTNTPTPTLSPTPEGGGIAGKMVWLTSQTAIANGGIILCYRATDTEESCTVNAIWGQITSADGSFAYSGLQPGQYIILYNPERSSSGEWEDVDGLTIDLSQRSHNCIFSLTQQAECVNFVPFFGAGALTLQKDFKVNISSTQGNHVMEGAIYSHQFGLTLEFHEREPVGLTVIPASIGEITIEVQEKE